MSLIFRRTSLKRSRLKRRPPRHKPGFDDPKYRAWIKTLPCAVPRCFWQQHTVGQPPSDGRWWVIEAHHAGDHGYAQRAPDRTCMPLCTWHHREGPDSAHVLGKRFWAYHGIDRDALISELQAQYDNR